MMRIVAGENFVLPGMLATLSVHGAVGLGRLYGIAVVPDGGRTWLSLQDRTEDWIEVRDEGAIAIRVDRLPEDARRLHVGIYARRGATTIRGILPASFNLAGRRLDVESDSIGATFLSFAEIYLRENQWKMRACAEWSAAGVEQFAARRGSTASDISSAIVDGNADFGATAGQLAWKSGSAFLIGPGIAATNAHVVSGVGRITAVGDMGRFEAECVVADEAADLALVRLSGAMDGRAVAFRPDLDLACGEHVLAIGFPMSGLLGAGPQITSGMVSACLGPANDTRLIQISTPIQPGSSGGPILDGAGRLIGVAVASLTDAQNVNFAVRASLVSYLAQSIGIDVSTAAESIPITPDRILRECRRSLFRLECPAR